MVTVVTADSPPGTLPQSSKHNNNNNQPFRFLDLPSELRLKVYSQLLIVGKIFYTPTPWEIRKRDRFKDLSSYEIPQLQLLRVNKQVHNEAEPVYLSKNLFVLPPQWPQYSPFRDKHGDMKYSRPRDRPLFSSLGLDYVRHVSIAFTSANEGWTAIRSTLWDAADSEDPNILENMDGAARLVFFHSAAMGHQAHNWKLMVDTLEHFSKGLRSLDMDFSDAYCELGCHRLVYTKFGFLEEVRPQRVRLLGLRGKEESENVERAAEKLGLGREEFVKKYGVVVNPEEDSWAVYKADKKALKSKEHKEKIEEGGAGKGERSDSGDVEGIEDAIESLTH
ncbi:hypothetical protein BDV96DRAFT_687507 [Lophiotrema nucula]|uniref:F-box domain-containing protein n=1 Tax=Lophiotrema nucula TaxID=690887 RepID=A0A6A5Z6C8_9PLEO|nr:hypothetical protein BDV96DRAFT_687507 [Lophiotrema nucula]